MASIDGTLPETGLHKGTNWWGAFVIGLAGTILVTGIAPYVVQGTGALGIILIGVMTIAGCFLCLCLAELATMWPDRTGGIPGTPPSRSGRWSAIQRPGTSAASPAGPTGSAGSRSRRST